MKVFRLPINLSLKYMPYLFRVQVKRHEIDFAIHENFSLAPQEIKIALLQAALNADKRSLGLVRIYSAGQNFQGLDKIITAGDGRPANSSQGSSFNLTDVFQRVNQQYFHNSMEPPQLTWSQKRTHRKLGSYAADTDTVTISRTFDHASTPEYVIDFIMYHELLHKWLGVNKARSHNHNKRFKVLEKQFRQYTQAENYIRRLNQINRLQTNRKFKLIN